VIWNLEFKKYVKRNQDYTPSVIAQIRLKTFETGHGVCIIFQLCLQYKLKKATMRLNLFRKGEELV
jgi:hypothetical protein